MATLTSNSLDNCTSIPDFIPAGTKMVFSSTQAPPSWTKLTTHDNKALRLVTGSPSPGGSTVFSTVFPASQRPVAGSINAANSAATFQAATVPVSATVGNFDAFSTWTIQAATISTAQMAIHDHSYNRRATGTNTAGQTGAPLCIKNGLEAIAFGASGGGGSHNHGWPGSAQHTHPLGASAHSHTQSSAGPHSHGFATTAQDFAIKYVDVIVCSKN